MRGGIEPEQEFRYYELSSEERNKITDQLRGRLQEEAGIVLAYLHGGFPKERPFRDIDVALWIRDEEEAWHYTVDLSAELETEIGLPIDTQVMNKAPLPIRHEVLTKGILIVSRDDVFRTRLLDETLRQYMDLQQALNIKR